MSELTQSDKDTLRNQVEREWVEGALARDWALSILADDVVYQAPDTPEMHGKAQVREFLEAFPTISTFSQKVEKLWGNADVAGCTISFRGVLEGDDGPASIEGKGLGTASKESGEWLWTAWCWNLDSPS